MKDTRGRGDCVIKVMLVDDHSIVRDGLRSMLSKVSDIEVIGEAENGREAVDMTQILSPDVLVMDIGMKDLNGIEATRQIIASGSKTRILALSMHSDRQYVSEMLRAGASGYLLKDTAFDELVHALREVAEGRVCLAHGVTGIVVEDYVQRMSGAVRAQQDSAERPLSPREREVLQLCAEGRNTKEIAAALQISVKTVETHRRQIMDKLGVYNLAGLIKYAMRNGYASLDD